MIIVDDRLSIEALAGRLPSSGAVATTWCFHFRLLRALSGPKATGALGRAAPANLLVVAATPPPDRLSVLDPRTVTTSAAEMATRYELNMLASELVAWAVRAGAEVRLHSSNVGRNWPQIFESEGIRLTVV